MESLLRLSRAKGMLSEDDLDKATCWVHDISDVVNLHEIADIAKNKDIKNRDMQSEIKLIKRDLENCNDMLKRSEMNEKELINENGRLKTDCDKLKYTIDENIAYINKLEHDNERLRNKIKLANSEMKRRVDDLLTEWL